MVGFIQVGGVGAEAFPIVRRRPVAEFLYLVGYIQPIAEALGAQPAVVIVVVPSRPVLLGKDHLGKAHVQVRGCKVHFPYSLSAVASGAEKFRKGIRRAWYGAVVGCTVMLVDIEAGQQ